MTSREATPEVVVRCRAFCSLCGRQCQVKRDDHDKSRHYDATHMWGDFRYEPMGDDDA